MGRQHSAHWTDWEVLDVLEASVTCQMNPNVRLSSDWNIAVFKFALAVEGITRTGPAKVLAVAKTRRALLALARRMKHKTQDKKPRRPARISSYS